MGVLAAPSRMFALPTAAIALIALALMQDVGTAQAKNKPEAELKLARDYALVACLRHRYPGSELAAEADVWAAGLVERGSVPADFYRALGEYVRNTAPEPEGSKAGPTMRLKSCIDFYNSPALTAEIRKLLRR